MKKSWIVAMGGMTTGLSLLILLLTGIIPIGTFALPAIAGMLLIVIVIEAGRGWGYAIYVAVSILAIFITPDRPAAIMYIIIFGHYPVTKSLIEKIRFSPVQWLLKLIVFNISTVLVFIVFPKILTRDADFLNEFIKYGIALGFVASNLIFILYDIASTRLITAYIHIYRKKIFKSLK